MLALAVQRKARHPWRALVLSNAAYLSTMMSSFTALLRCFTKAATPFYPTGQRQTTRSSSMRRLNPACGAVLAEVAAMVVLVVVHSTMRNYGFAAIGAAPLVARFCARNAVLFECSALLLFCVVLFQVVLGLSSGVSQVLYTPTIVSVQY
jgi:hypothetical protein